MIGIPKRDQMDKVITAYRNLKGRFEGFKSLFREALGKDAYFEIGYAEHGGDTITLTVLGVPVTIFFSLALDKEGAAYGRLAFTAAARSDETNHHTPRRVDRVIWTLYVDQKGNLQDSLARKMKAARLEDGQDLENLLFLLVERVLSLPEFQAGDEG